MQECHQRLEQNGDLGIVADVRGSRRVGEETFLQLGLGKVVIIGAGGGALAEDEEEEFAESGVRFGLEVREVGGADEVLEDREGEVADVLDEHVVDIIYGHEVPGQFFRYAREDTEELLAEREGDISA